LKTEFDITLEQVKDYNFTATFDDESLPHITIDEPTPIGTGEGPSSSRLLATAVGHCLSASLLFCLQKSHIPMKDVSTKVHTTLARNETGKWRVQGLGVNIKADPVTEGDRERMRRCVEIFEDFCVVTQSVRKGIDVQVKVQTD
jgi:organic hydroperoxide reductase OsmC/OhrA